MKATTRVLLVEDNPGDARVMKELLAEQPDSPLELDWKQDLATGIESLGGADVVLLDLNLPDSLGLDTVIKVSGKAPQVPVVVVTGLNDEALAIEALRSGAQDYLVKGQLTGAQVVRSIRYAMARAARHKAPPQPGEEVRRLKTVASGLASLEVAWTAGPAAASSSLAEVMAAFEQGLRRQCVIEEKAYPEVGGMTGVERMGAALQAEHRQMLKRLGDIARKAEQMSQAGGPLPEKSERLDLLGSLRRLLDDSWEHAEKEDEFESLCGHSA